MRRHSLPHSLNGHKKGTQVSLRWPRTHKLRLEAELSQLKRMYSDPAQEFVEWMSAHYEATVESNQCAQLISPLLGTVNDGSLIHRH